jgi:hypothetical protein
VPEPLALAQKPLCALPPERTHTATSPRAVTL